MNNPLNYPPSGLPNDPVVFQRPVVQPTGHQTAAGLEPRNHTRTDPQNYPLSGLPNKYTLPGNQPNNNRCFKRSSSRLNRSTILQIPDVQPNNQIYSQNPVGLHNSNNYLQPELRSSSYTAPNNLPFSYTPPHGLSSTYPNSLVNIFQSGRTG